MDDRLAGVVVSDALRERIKSGAQLLKRRRRPLFYRRPALVALAASLALVCGIGVAAGAMSYYERFIERMGEDMRTLAQPVAGASVLREGIRMEVLAAVNDGGTAIMYLSLADEAGQRVDTGTELYQVQMLEHGLAHGMQVDYDEANRTAIFRLEAAVWGDAALPEEPVALNVVSILTGMERHEGQDTGLTVADIVAANPEPETMTEVPAGGFGVSYGADLAVGEAMGQAIDAGEMPLLMKDSAPLTLDTPAWSTVGAAGVVDGLLHIQFEPQGDAGYYGRTHFYLEYPGAEEAEYYPAQLTTAEVARGERTEEGPYTHYEYYEQILELPKDAEPEETALYVEGTSCEEKIVGNWAVTFELEDSPPKLVSAPGDEVDLNGWVVHRFEVSPVGITANARGEQGPDSEMLMMTLYLKDGSEVGTHSASMGGGVDGMVSKVTFSRPIDLNDVGKLVVNGREITLLPE